MARTRTLVLLGVLCGLALGSCSFDYGANGTEGTEELPSAVFHGFVHNIVDQDAKVLEIRAELAESYVESRRMVLRGVSFTEYDRSTGAAVTVGHAERAVVYTDTEDAEFSGSIVIDSSREDALLDAEYLAWDSDAKRLTSRLDRSVSVRRKDGSWIRGAGFSADLRRRSFAFRESVEGNFVVDEEESEAEASSASTSQSSATGVDR